MSDSTIEYLKKTQPELFEDVVLPELDVLSDVEKQASQKPIELDSTPAELPKLQRFVAQAIKLTPRGKVNYLRKLPDVDDATMVDGRLYVKPRSQKKYKPIDPETFEWMDVAEVAPDIAQVAVGAGAAMASGGLLMPIATDFGAAAMRAVLSSLVPGEESLDELAEGIVFETAAGSIGDVVPYKAMPVRAMSNRVNPLRREVNAGMDREVYQESMERFSKYPDLRTTPAHLIGTPEVMGVAGKARKTDPKAFRMADERIEKGLKDHFQRIIDKNLVAEDDAGAGDVILKARQGYIDVLASEAERKTAPLYKQALADPNALVPIQPLKDTLSAIRENYPPSSLPKYIQDRINLFVDGDVQDIPISRWVQEKNQLSKLLKQKSSAFPTHEKEQIYGALLQSLDGAIDQGSGAAKALREAGKIWRQDYFIPKDEFNKGIARKVLRLQETQGEWAVPGAILNAKPADLKKFLKLADDPETRKLARQLHVAKMFEEADTATPGITSFDAGFDLGKFKAAFQKNKKKLEVVFEDDPEGWGALKDGLDLLQRQERYKSTVSPTQWREHVGHAVNMVYSMVPSKTLRTAAALGPGKDILINFLTDTPNPKQAAFIFSNPETTKAWRTMLKAIESTNKPPKAEKAIWGAALHLATVLQDFGATPEVRVIGGY